jgi:hypothetical protein
LRVAGGEEWSVFVTVAVSVTESVFDNPRYFRRILYVKLETRKRRENGWRTRQEEQEW